MKIIEKLIFWQLNSNPKFHMLKKIELIQI